MTEEQSGGVAFLVRRATDRDVKSVCELLFALKKQYGSCIEQTFDDFRATYENGVCRALSSANNAIWVAEMLTNYGKNSHLELLGFLSTTWRLVLRLGGDVGVLEEVYVRAEFRRRGIGFALWKAASDELRQRGVRIVEVVTSLAHPGQRQYADKIGLQWYATIHKVSLES